LTVFVHSQDPQCEGIHQHRKLFNAKVLFAERKSFPISIEWNGNNNSVIHCTVNGGALHNITRDSEFGVYLKSDINFSNQICVLHVDVLDHFSFTAKLLPSVDVAHPLIAVQTKFGRQAHLRVHIPLYGGFRKIYDDLRENPRLAHNLNHISLVNRAEEAQVEVSLITKDEVRFTTHFKVAPQSKKNKLSTITRVTDGIGVDPIVLAWIFSKMAHFYGELEHSYEDSRISYYVKVEFLELQAEHILNKDTDSEDLILKPATHLNLYTNGAIELPLHDMGDGELPYGMRLINRSQLSLYAYVFHFSSHGLKICE
jgi:hypothetical protein